MSTSRPNIVLIITDQQRWDTLSTATGGWGHTPHIDRLAQEGVYFEQCYCAAPSCVPSRASFFNANWPRHVGPMKNGDRWSHSWVEQFQAAGYRTLNVGKMHTQPVDAPCGFDQRFIVENKDRFYSPRFYDAWDQHLKQLGVEPPNRWTLKEAPDYEQVLGAVEWPLPRELHYDYFVGQNARWLIEDLDDQPFFLQVGFPGPHAPYDPPPEYLAAINEDDIPIPPPRDPADDIPPHRRYRQIMIEGNHDGVKWQPTQTPEQLRRLRRYYAANVTLIDEQVGAIVEALRQKGKLDNTIIVFTSDHGDALGEHGQIQKWTMFDYNTRVPLIAWAPGRLPAGTRCQELIQQFDLVPLLFELAGIDAQLPDVAISAKDVVDGKRPGRECVFAEHGGCNMLPDIDSVVMARSRDWKLVSYPGRDYGELYDLRNDPTEYRNLYEDPAHQDIVQALTKKLAQLD